MGEIISLTAADGHVLDAYGVMPASRPVGGLVVVQEVFGVNRHIREVCDRFAAAGYAVVAPSLFDRVRRDVDLDYDSTGLAAGRALRMEIGWEAPLLDVEAAIVSLTDHGKVGIIGYCWGESVTWLAATRLTVAAAVCYYGGQIVQFKGEHAKCPVMMHFGEKDPYIPTEDIAVICQALPEAKIFRYPAGHGFNCDRRDDFDLESARLAGSRTLDFLAEHLN